MKIILNATDIIALIKDNYEGITDVKLDEKVEATLEVDINKFLKPKQTMSPITVPKPDPKTLIEVNQEEAKKGLMASGGQTRPMRRF